MKFSSILCLILVLSLVLCGCEDVLENMPSSSTIQATTGSSEPNQEPTVSEPDSTDSKPTDPQPTDPQPTDPQPTDPQPTDPQPTDPQPTDPEPTQPTEPGPTDPDVPEVDWDQFACIRVAEALQIAQSHITSPSDEWYYAIVTVISITNDFYGEMMVADETGYISVYGTYNADGSMRYFAMDPKPEVGDTVLLYGNLQNYGGHKKEFVCAYVIDFRKGSSMDLPGSEGSQGLEFTFENDSYIVSGIGTCTDKDIVIPSVHNGYPVTGIGYDAFFWVYSIDSITIPSGVTNISDCAFRYSSLKRIVLPEDLERISSSMFAFTQLEEIVLPASVHYIDDFAFYSCSNLRSIELHEGITFIGEFAFSLSGIERIVIPKSINQISAYLCSSMSNLSEVILHDQIQQIGEGAFSHSSLPSITIPHSVTYIGTEAFLFCHSLKTVRFEGSAPYICNDAFYAISTTVEYPAGNATWHSSVMLDYSGAITYSGYASSEQPWLRFQLSEDGSFYILTGVDDPSLTEIVIPYMYDGLPVRSIADFAFAGSSKIRSIQLPGGLLEIGENAFANCGNLNLVVFTGDMPSVSGNAFSGVSCQVVYPQDNPSWNQSGRKQYGGNLNWTVSNWELDYSFDPIEEYYNVCGIGSFIGTYLVIPEYYDGYPVRIIQSSVFRYCQNLETVIISDYVKRIEAEVFADCPNLASVTLSKNLNSLESGVFRNCVSLKAIRFSGNKLKEIQSNCFAGCVSLKEIDFSGTKVKDIQSYCFAGCVSLEKVTFSNTLEIIWDYAFYGCESLREVVLPDSVTEILGGAFSGCSSLYSVQLSASLQQIGSCAFSHCAQLQEITFPASLTHIHACAFEHCTALSVITFLGDKPYMPDGASSPFENVVATVYYPVNNDTWVGMHNYLGDLTWIPKEFP